VSNAHAGAGKGTVLAFNVDNAGVLTAVGPAFPNGQTAPCWVEISHDGRFLFAVNTASATISSFQINADGSLVLLANTPFRVGQGAVDARLSPDGSTLSVTGGSGHVVSNFTVDGGTLTELARRSPPAARRPGSSCSDTDLVGRLPWMGASHQMSVTSLGASGLSTLAATPRKRRQSRTVDQADSRLV
jgi:hypothetical protein